MIKKGSKVYSYFYLCLLFLQKQEPHKNKEKNQNGLKEKKILMVFNPLCASRYKNKYKLKIK